MSPLERCWAEQERRSLVMAEAQQFLFGHVPGRDEAAPPDLPKESERGRL